jgi:hypothetical protein
LGAPGCAAYGVEGVAGVPQRRSRFGDPALAPQPLTVHKQETGTLERPVGEVGAERLIEATGGLLVVLCEKRTRVLQPSAGAGRFRRRRGLPRALLRVDP